jgi:hypothetical protein
MSCGVNQHVQIGPNQIYSFWEKKNYFHSYNVGFYVKTLSCGEDYLGFLSDRLEQGSPIQAKWAKLKSPCFFLLLSYK